MLKKSVNVRLLKHREKHNQNRPELDAVLKKYNCTHSVYTLAFEKAKQAAVPSMYIDEHGLFQFSNPSVTDGAMPGGKPRNAHTFEFEKIEITADMWYKLADTVLNDRANIAVVYAEMLSTATH